MNAARVTDMISSPATSGNPIPIIRTDLPTVFIGGFPAARVGDTCTLDAIAKGSLTVKIDGLFAARVGDPTGSGGIISPPGALNVKIG